MPQISPIIAIVEDDASLRRALARLLHAVGWHTVTFASAEAFLQTGLQQPPQCLVLDVRLPGMSGLELVEQFVATGLACRSSSSRVTTMCSYAYGRSGPAWWPIY